MKKIIKSSTLFLGACFFAGALHAQLSSDKPALTAQQMTDIMQKRNADAKSAATTNAVSVSSNKPALTAQQMTDLMQKRNADAKTDPATVTPASDKPAPVNAPANLIAKNEPAKTATVQQPVTASSLPAVSTQGAVKPVTSEPATESKVPQPPMQSEKPVSSGQQ